MTAPFSAQDSLVAAMVLTAAADGRLSNVEREVIGAILALKPVFKGYDRARFGTMVDIVGAMLEEDSGVDQVMTLLTENLPEHLRDTAYAMACDVTAADGLAKQEELQLLALMRERLAIEPLLAAAIERAARARFRMV
jgi:tellurite resistance protein